MSELKKASLDSETSIDSKKNSSDLDQVERKGPLSFLSGALTSACLAWLSFIFSQKVLNYFAIHSLQYKSPIAQSVASGFKTLVIGMSFLATFTFAFIGLGLSLVFIRSLFSGNTQHVD